MMETWHLKLWLSLIVTTLWKSYGLSYNTWNLVTHWLEKKKDMVFREIKWNLKTANQSPISVTYPYFVVTWV